MLGGGRPYRGRWIRVGPAGKAGGGLKQEEEGDPGGGNSVNVKGVVRP